MIINNKNIQTAVSREGQPETAAACTPTRGPAASGHACVWHHAQHAPCCTAIFVSPRTRAGQPQPCSADARGGGNKRATYPELARLAANGMAAPLYMPMPAEHHRHSAQQRCRDGHSNGCQPACHKQLRGRRNCLAHKHGRSWRHAGASFPTLTGIAQVTAEGHNLGSPSKHTTAWAGQLLLLDIRHGMGYNRARQGAFRLQILFRASIVVHWTNGSSQLFASFQ